tara:strand:+ start:787 stop:1218 length:432 start_codon:yes stop_codon:yes gene_type:complete
MSVLNKLLGMLDELKEENPELANKALLAAETLKSGVDPEDLEEEWEEEAEEEFDDSYIVISEEHTNEFFDGSKKLESKLSEYGVYMRDHEVKKVLLLEEIEQVRSGNENFLQYLREKYSLDPNAGYTLELDEEGSGNLAFVKQ